MTYLESKEKYGWIYEQIKENDSRINELKEYIKYEETMIREDLEYEMYDKVARHASKANGYQSEIRVLKNIIRDAEATLDKLMEEE